METLLALGKCCLRAACLLKPWKEGFAFMQTWQHCSEPLEMKQGNETPQGSDSASPPELLHTACREELSRNPFSCCLSAGCVRQHNPELQLAPALLLSQPDLRFPCPLLSCSRPGLLGHGKCWGEPQEPLPITREEIHLLLASRVSASQTMGGIFHLSDNVDDSCSLLLMSWVCVAKISPSCLNLTAGSGQHKHTQKEVEVKQKLYLAQINRI